MNKEEQEHWFWTISKVVGAVVIIVLIISIPYKIGYIEGEKTTVQEIGFVIPEEPCEYKKGDFYFKGSCSDVSGLVNLKTQQEDFNDYVWCERLIGNPNVFSNHSFQKSIQ